MDFMDQDWRQGDQLSFFFLQRYRCKWHLVCSPNSFGLQHSIKIAIRSAKTKTDEPHNNRTFEDSLLTKSTRGWIKRFLYHVKEILMRKFRKMLCISEPGASLIPTILFRVLYFSSLFRHYSWKSCIINVLLPFPQLSILQTILTWLLPSCSTKTALVKTISDILVTKSNGLSFSPHLT